MLKSKEGFPMSRFTTTRAAAAFAIFAGVAALAPAACATAVTPGPSSGGAGGTGGAGGATDTSSMSSTGGAGGCTHKADCAAFGDACNEGNCVNSMCVKAPRNDGFSCDDGLFCTEGDTCQGGVCSGQPTACPTTGECSIGVCDPVTDACTEQPGNNGQLCSGSDPCAAVSACNGGQCMTVEQTDCSVFDDFCTVGVCDPNVGCVQQPSNEGGPCDDGLFCTVGDACAGGVCTGKPMQCVPGGNTCLTGSCDEFNQTCTVVPGNNGQACDDKNPCTTGEACNSGTCKGGSPLAAGAACDDNNACTQASVCDGNGACTGSNPILQCALGDGCCPAGCTIATDPDCAPVQLIVNGDFTTNDLTGWFAANNPVGGNDTVSTFEVSLQVGENVPSVGPSARVLTQDFVVPPQVSVSAVFSMSFYQAPSSPLDPQDVTVIVKDPFDMNADGMNQNAFRVDLIDPAQDQFIAPILYNLYAPVGAVGAMGVLGPVVVNDPSLKAFLQANIGKSLRLRIAQVESTFPWQLQFDDVSLIVQ
jgi:hypothetical protein